MGKLDDAIKTKHGPNINTAQYLYEQVVNGRLASDIADEFGVSREAVRKRLIALNATTKRVWKMRKPRAA